MELWCVVVDADCGLVNKNDLLSELDNIVVGKNDLKDSSVYTVEMVWFIMVDK